MIISHKHKFIFIKTKKTAGTSIEIALSSICGGQDIITPINEEDELIRQKMANRGPQNTLIPFSKYRISDWLRLLKNRKRPEYYNHMTASIAKEYIGADIWNSYYKFCFDRHPVTKAISHYKWRGQKVGYTSFEEYLKSDDVQLIKGDTFYKDKADNYLVDKVYKMEEMERSFTEIARKLGLSSLELEAPSFNTKKSKANKALDPEVLEKEFSAQLRAIFKTEFEDIYN